MRKIQASNLREQFFFSSEFQKKWKKYLKAFGSDLNDLFGDNYDKKISFSSGLEYLLNNKYNDAYHEMRHFESACITDADKQIFHRLITLCLNEKEMSGAKVGDWIKQSRGGYYRVIKRTPESTVIKKAFDHELVYVKQSLKADSFAIELTDLKTYQFLDKQDLAKIKNFFVNHPEEETDFLQYTDIMLLLRETILKAHFKEAEWEFRQFSFYRCTRENVAFIVNLKDYADHIGVTYGFTSIADQEHLKHYGEDNDDIKLRFSSVIKSEQDKIDVAVAVKNVYDAYLDKSKDEILSLKKERQKKFLKTIAEKLKPLGFNKKASKWTRLLDEDFCLEFEAQKSQWSDSYYFNVNVYHKDVQFPQCYSTRINTNGKGIYNWQLMSVEEINALLDETIENVLYPIMRTPLSDLGNSKEIWMGCFCPRDKCEACWVRKNLWERKKKKI